MITLNVERDECLFLMRTLQDALQLGINSEQIFSWLDLLEQKLIEEVNDEPVQD